MKTFFAENSMIFAHVQWDWLVWFA